MWLNRKRVKKLLVHHCISGLFNSCINILLSLKLPIFGTVVRTRRLLAYKHRTSVSNSVIQWGHWNCRTGHCRTDNGGQVSAARTKKHAQLLFTSVRCT